MFKSRIKKRVDITSEDYDSLFDSIEDEKNLADMYKPGEKKEEVGILEEGEIDGDMLFMTGAEIAQIYEEEPERVELVRVKEETIKELGRIGTYIVGIITMVGFIYFIYSIMNMI